MCASLLWTRVGTTSLKCGGLQANCSEQTHFIIPITQSDTTGMACQASACVTRGWIALSSLWPCGDGPLMLCGRGNLLSFWECLCFIISAIAAVSCLNACTGPVSAKNTLPSAPGTERMNEWMMHLYSAFIVYCCTPKALYNHVGGSLLNHHQLDLSTRSSCPIAQDDAFGPGSSTILGWDPWRLGTGLGSVALRRHLAEQYLSWGARLVF